MEAIQTPRVNQQYLDSFVNQTVRLVGKVTQLRGTEATIDSNGMVTCFLTRDSHLTVGNAVEVIGKVNQDLSIKALQTIDWGNNVDMNAINALVEANHKYSEIFYDKQ